MPVLVLVGEDDIADIHAQAKLIEHGVAGSKLVMIPGGGHLLNLTSPQRFADELTRFLTELDAPS
jgi:pimeloyl-ACP methyl ester carboxylesterase